MMTLEEAKKNRKEKYKEYLEACRAYDVLHNQKIKDYYVGKYIKFKRYNQYPAYMHVNCICGENYDESLFYFKGSYIGYCFDERHNDLYFQCYQLYQNIFRFNDFNEDGSCDFIKIITEEEFMEAFDKGITAILERKDALR